MNSAEHYTTRYLETDDLDQYNALLRYTFQVTEEELTATGWKDDEIKQSKFPVLERADVLGCFDGDTLVSQFAVYPLKMNIYDEVYHVGFVTSVCTYPEYTGQGIMKKLMIQGLTRMYEEGKTFALLYPSLDTDTAGKLEAQQLIDDVAEWLTADENLPAADRCCIQNIKRADTCTLISEDEDGAVFQGSFNLEYYMEG